MANEVKTPIPARIYNAAVGGHVAGADDIIDDKTGMVVSELVGNKPATSEENPFNGMGVVILPMNIQEVEEDDTTVQKNILTQAMMNQTNTKYVIKYDYVLGEDITIPANCVLEFDGGSINGNYALSLNRCLLKGTPKLYCLLSGNTINDIVYASWFGMKGDGVTDDTDAIQKAINILLGQTLIFDSKGDIYIAGTINCAGGSQQHRIIKGNYGTDYTRIVTDSNYSVDTPIFNISSSEWTFEGIFLKNIGNNKKGVGFKTQGRCQDITIRKCYIEGLNVGYQYKDGSCYNLFDQNATYYCNKGIEIVTDTGWCGAINIQTCKFTGCTYGCYINAYCSSVSFNDSYFEGDTYKLYCNNNRAIAKFYNCYWSDESKECITLEAGTITIDGGCSAIGGAYTSQYNPEDLTFEANSIVVNGGVLYLNNVEVHSAGSRPKQNGSCIKINGGIIFVNNVSFAPRNEYQYGLRVLDCNDSEKTCYLQRIKSFTKNGIFAPSDFICLTEIDSNVGGTIQKLDTDNGHGGNVIRITKNSKSNIGIKIPYSIPSSGRYSLKIKFKLVVNNDVLEPSVYINNVSNTVLSEDKTGRYWDISTSWYGLTNMTNRINNTDFIYEESIPLDIVTLDGNIMFTLGLITGAPEGSYVDVYYICLVKSNEDVLIGRFDNADIYYKGVVRPNINLKEGLSMFDTSVKKPIYYNGTAWVDATGTPV